MAFGDQVGGFSTAAVAVGAEHVRLSYEYLDRGDPDGYASLLDQRAILDEPGRALVHGRAAVADLPRGRGRGRHDVHGVFAADGQVAAVGRFRSGGGERGVDFADIFTISEHGLLVRQRCYYFVNPG